MSDAARQRYGDDVDVLRREDPPAFAAYSAAAMVSAMDDDEPSGVQWWASLGSPMTADGRPASLQTNVEALAGFVRQHGAAPPEALFRHAAAQGIHGASPDGWAELTVAQRAAFGTFASVLGTVDGLKATEAALAASQNPQIPRSEFIPIEDTILRVGGDATDIAPMFAEDRKVTIIPGTGLPPGHAAEQRPAAPAIGAGNTERAKTFLPAEAGPDGSDRRGHGSELGAAAPLAPPAGGTTTLGHGFDRSLAFNETGAPPEGQAPAPASAAANTAIARPPAAPAPAPNAPDNLPHKETHDATDTGQNDGVAAAGAGAPGGAGTDASAGENAGAPARPGGLSGGDAQQAASEAAHGEGDAARAGGAGAASAGDVQQAASEAAHGERNTAAQAAVNHPDGDVDSDGRATDDDQPAAPKKRSRPKRA